MTTSIFPEELAGGVPIRDGSGNPTHPANVEQAYPPAPAFVSSCPITALPSDCEARIEPRQINAIVSELTALAECFDPNGPWSCGSLQNLCTAFNVWKASYSTGSAYVSSDPGNTLVTGSDGKLYVPPIAYPVPLNKGGTGATTQAGAKANLGIGNVDNTSDLNKPISTATQTALNGKITKTGDAMTGALSLITPPTAPAHAASKQYVDSVLSTATAGTVLEAPNNALMYGRKSLGWYRAVDVAGDTMIGPLTLSAASPALYFNKSAGANGSYIFGNRVGVQRWRLDMGDSAPETGSNVGTNFAISRYGDNGTYLGTSLSINRATGSVQVNEPISPPDVATKNYADSKLSAFGGTVAGNLSVTGTIYGGGAIAANGNIISQAGISASGNIHCGGFLSACGNTEFGLQRYENHHFLKYGPDWYWQWNGNNGDLYWVGWPNTIKFHLDNAGSIRITGVAYKPGGGAWADSSDQRIKTIAGKFTAGLSAIRSLEPVRYTYKGNDTTEAPEAEATAPYRASPHYDDAVSGKEHIGFRAQQIENHFPELVSKRSGYIDGEKTDDVRMVDTSALVYALVNACQELDRRNTDYETKIEALLARVEQLESRSA